MEKSSKYRKGPLLKKKVEEDAKLMLKHYKWLSDFDDIAKDKLLGTEVTNVQLLKLLTILEGNVSSEVSKLRSKPNRATKFLTQIRKRISMIKVGGYMIDPSLDHELFPTYGLLLKHIIDITLVSSKVEKLGAQQVASELYYLLKLVLDGDCEYVLDVILCSTLDEHASSTHQVGYQLFAFVVEDHRYYLDTHAGTMKYCAVASLLHSSCNEGKVFVDKNLPQKMDAAFPKYLSKALGADEVNRKGTLKVAMLSIRPATVKSVSRNRLVIVSGKQISRSSSSQQRSHSSQDPDSDAESSTSTVLNIPSSSIKREVPSSSSTSAWLNQNGQSSVHHGQDPIGIILGDIGILDTAGDDVVISDHEDGDRKNLPEESCVSSSSAVVKKGSYSRSIFSEPLDAKANYEDEGENEGDVVEIGSHGDDDELLSIPSDDGDHETIEDDYNPDEDTEPLRDSENEERDGASRERETRSSLSQQNDEEDANNDKAHKPIPSDNEDSDLEILSVVGEPSVGDGDDASTSSRERDEAEAESGEDYVPNYDVDSDQETQTLTVPLAKPLSANMKNDAEPSADKSETEAQPKDAEDSNSVKEDSTSAGKMKKSLSSEDKEESGEVDAVNANTSRTRRTGRSLCISLSRSDVPEEGQKRNSSRLSLTPWKRTKITDEEESESDKKKSFKLSLTPSKRARIVDDEEDSESETDEKKSSKKSLTPPKRVKTIDDEEDSESEKKKSSKISLTPPKRTKIIVDEDESDPDKEPEKEDNQKTVTVTPRTPTARRGRGNRGRGSSSSTRASSQLDSETASPATTVTIATRRSTRYGIPSGTPRKQDDDVESNASFSSVASRQGLRSTGRKSVATPVTPRGRGRGRGKRN